jgi:hypothetical protein
MPFRRLILAGGEVERFHDPAPPFLHPEDLAIALDIDRYDFAVRVHFEDDRQSRASRSPPDAEGGDPALRLFAGN